MFRNLSHNSQQKKHSWLIIRIIRIILEGGVAQWVGRLTRNVEVVGSNPTKAPRHFLEQETLSLLLSTGWFQERILACFHNRTKIN